MLYALRFEGDALKLQQVLELLTLSGIKDRWVQIKEMMRGARSLMVEDQE